jgi:hypothetical protein
MAGRERSDVSFYLTAYFVSGSSAFQFLCRRLIDTFESDQRGDKGTQGRKRGDSDNAEQGYGEGDQDSGSGNASDQCDP